VRSPRAAGAGPLAETDLYDSSKLADAVALVNKAVTDCETRYHDAFVEKVERRYEAYRGLAGEGESKNPQRDSDEEDWHSNVTTPYVLQTCEGMLATMLEPSPRFDVKPRPKPDEPLDEVVERMKGVKAIEDVLSYALQRDRFPQKQRDFMQQDLIAGITVFKDYWITEHRDVHAKVPEDVPIFDGYGSQIDSVQTEREDVQKDVLVKDDACAEVRDVRDFFWPSQAASVEKAEYLIDRTWQSYSALKRMQDEGLYKNVEDLKGANARAVMANLSKRERRLRGVDRTQDLVEVLEYWTPERVITVGNRTVLLRDDPNPLWNGRMPFVVCSAMPDGFQIPGISVVEALAQLQDMLWLLQNQRLDVVRMLANLITLIRSDVDDPESFEWAPNAQWFVEDVGQVDTLKIDPTVASITLQAEALLKGDLQNIMGGLPMNSGTDSQTVDQQTATGVSIITTIAQRIIQARKQHYLWAYAQLGQDFLLLYQQFLSGDRVIPILGPQGAEAFRTVSPFDVQGDYDVMIDVTSDSLQSQERRASSNSLLQIASNVAQIFAMSGTPLNLKAFMEDALDSYDKQDKQRYFLPPQAAPAVAQPPGGPSQVPSANGAPPGPGGITNASLAAGPLSPSGGDASQSPETAMATMLRQSGGVSNGGGAPA
jgi:hypothetical protein